MSDQVLLIGSGGREHAIAWKLAQSAKVGRIFVAPGSAAIGQLAKCLLLPGAQLNVSDHEAVAAWCKANGIHLVVVGPEGPLAEGLGDVLQKHEVPCFGPSWGGARIEADKSWSKEFMENWQIPTARFKSFTTVAAAKRHINR